jgi:hypothetical protein
MLAPNQIQNCCQAASRGPQVSAQSRADRPTAPYRTLRRPLVRSPTRNLTSTNMVAADRTLKSASSTAPSAAMMVSARTRPVLASFGAQLQVGVCSSPLLGPYGITGDGSELGDHRDRSPRSLRPRFPRRSSDGALSHPAHECVQPFSPLKRRELFLEACNRVQVQKGAPAHAGHAQRGQLGERRRLR